MITKEYIDAGIERAEAGGPPGLPPIKGYSSYKVRSLLNWLCAMDGANYLEIGTHRGSTLIPALYDNPHTIATCIDLWIGEGILQGVARTDLEANLAEYLPDHVVNIVEGDMFTLDLRRLIPGVNIYFYDGPHTREGQYQAFVRFDPMFAKRFVAVVDDWNWEEPREETRRAFEDLGYQVETSWELDAVAAMDKERWWNGLYVAIVEKSK